MMDYINIPQTIDCNPCRVCGSRPVIAQVGDIGYIVKCARDNRHYQTMPGLIDIEDWNRHNISPNDYKLRPSLVNSR